MSNNSISNSTSSSVPVQGIHSSNAATSATSVPAGILALPDGTLLKGQVTELKANHHVILQTAKGSILIKTDLPLQRGNEVVLRLDTSSSGVRARIISVDGRSPGELGRNVSLSNQPLPTALTASSTTSGTAGLPPTPVDIRLTSALPLRAILISASEGFDTLVERLNSFIIPRNFTSDGGGNFIVKLLPQTVHSVTTVNSSSQSIIDALENAATTSNTTAKIAHSLSTAANSTTATSTSTPPNQAASDTSSAPSARLAEGQLAARVIGTEQSGQAVVKTIMGTLKIDLPQLPGGRNVVLPPGTEITIQLLPANPNHFSNNTAALNSSNIAGILELSHHWHGIHQLYDTVQNINPAIAEQLTSAAIPTSGPKLATSILFFISALRGGDLAEWLGRSTLNRLEQAGHTQFIKKISTEFQTLSRLFTEPPGQNWQALFIPVQYSNGWHQLRMFIKRDEQETKDNISASRFIVELDLAQYGSIQLDGFIKNLTPKKRFDLIIRSSQPFPQQQQDDIQGIYYKIVELTGLHGNISFQVSQNFPNHPMEEIVAHHRNMVV